MYSTTEELEYALSKKSKKLSKFSKFFNELKILGLIFTVIFSGTYLITNAQLVIDNFTDRFSPTEVHGISQEISNASLNSEHFITENSAEKVDNLIQQYGDMIFNQQDIADDMNHFLQRNLDNYDFSFNLLPPTNRLVIPAINLDVPLVETYINNYNNFTETTFDADLENGVVKYPTTPDPGQGGNSFFFGHTSQEYRKNNPYGTVFRKIPQLKENDKIQIVWNGVLYEYKVLETIIVKPKNVNDTYVNFGEEGKEYITLMGCYPIGRTDKRMMVFAERI